MRYAFILVAALLLASPAGAQQPPLRTVQLSAGMHLIQAEVADSFGTRMQGLMFRKSMDTNAGMLFVFDDTSVHCMWMKNTLIPLAVAFIDETGKIVNILEMQPHDETSRCAAGPARYALEMNKGWFAQRGIKAGTRLRGLEKLQPRR